MLHGNLRIKLLRLRYSVEYGWPETLIFHDFLAMYRRNGLARGAVDKIISKTWETAPMLRHSDPTEEPDGMEVGLCKHLSAIRFWQQFAEADKRSIVGGYGAIILRIANNRKPNEPVDHITSGYNALIEAIPCWQDQIIVSQWQDDETADDFGQPLMWIYNEGAIPAGGSNHIQRSYQVHPDRVVVLSRDGSTNDRSQLEPGFNALGDAEKIMGGGAEGFFKNSKGTPVLDI